MPDAGGIARRAGLRPEEEGNAGGSETVARLAMRPGTDALEEASVNRRNLIKTAVSLPLVSGGFSTVFAIPESKSRKTHIVASRARPGDADWPSLKSWEKLKQAVEGRLLKPESPFAICPAAPESNVCREALQQIKNPFYIGDEVALTQTSGWTNAWVSQPSAYAVAAKSSADVVAAVNFARVHNLRLVIKGGGHSYQGTSNAPDSLLVWTRAINGIVVRDSFVPRGREGRTAPVPAVTIGAGAVWMDVYDAVTTQGGRYVQGGGCATVGVAGLIQGGGFGSFSKAYGLAAASLLEAEMVTADGVVRTVNAGSDADLFWAIKGGGGGTFGVITQLTLRAHELPNIFGDISVQIKAQSDAAFRTLIGEFIEFYAKHLFNPHWGESVKFGRHNTLKADLVFQGLDKETAAAVWREFLDRLRKSPSDFVLESAFAIEALPARHWWDVDYLQKYSKGSVLEDPRPRAPKSHAWWTGDTEQVGSLIHGYESRWLSAALLQSEMQRSLADALFAASRHWTVSLHFNKGLAGAPAKAVAAARDTSISPAALDAFALAIIAGGRSAEYSHGVAPDDEPAQANLDAIEIGRAMSELNKLGSSYGSYVSESNYFQHDWQETFWGSNYARLKEIKSKYDPSGLFFVRHGVGSEGWTEDGFTRIG
jgi:FAD/FMN-containing dehydrogenase